MKFKDMNGKEWSGSLTLGMCEELGKEQVDLINISLDTDEQVGVAVARLQSFFGNMQKVIRVARMICDPAGGTEFANAIDAPAYTRLRLALRDELLHFFPDGVRSGMLALLEKSAECQKQILTRTAELLDPVELLKALTPEKMQELARKSGQEAMAGI